MTGLNLEYFLRLIRAEPAFWWNTGIGIGWLTLIAWASRGRRRALQRCLVLSLAMHIGLLVYGGPQAVRWLDSPASVEPQAGREHLRSVQLAGLPGQHPQSPESLDETEKGSARAPMPKPWDHPQDLELAETTTTENPAAPDARVPTPPGHEVDAADLTLRVDVPEPALPVASPTDERPTDTTTLNRNDAQAAQPVSDDEKARVELAGTPSDVTQNVAPEPVAGLSRQTKPDRSGVMTGQRSVPFQPEPLQLSDPKDTAAPLAAPRGQELAGRSSEEDRMQNPLELSSEHDSGSRPSASQSSSDPGGLSFPEPDIAPTQASRPSLGNSANIPSAMAIRRPGTTTRAVGLMPTATADRAPADIPTRSLTPGARPGLEVPDVYRSRLAPNRSALAIAAGATPDSEQAVERALEWLARHQDPDGRWNGGTRLGMDGNPAKGESNFTAHCPPGDICAGECFYFEADTAMTGLALLAFLGAGHTHQSGPYARNVALGVNFLLNEQRPDGDLRGNSLGVGMYCHSIAALALTEAYALTNDERLRGACVRAIDFLVKARSIDNQAWRYRPPDPKDPMTLNGDTSILGWAVMLLKSGKEVGIPIRDDVRSGIMTWLNRVATGKAGGLAMYRPAGLSEGGEARPSMTAEAWVCRQFLGVGGPGAASDEASDYLLKHGPDRDPYNLYYWYYGTLALFQHGGTAWVRWNARVRDQIVRRQVRLGHADGSWDPAETRDIYNSRGGRIYTTALAALTLEVYYRYLRLYNAPATPLPPNTEDFDARRTGFNPDSREEQAFPVPETTKP